MAGAGYDIGIAASRAEASGAQSGAPVIINFSGGTIYGAGNNSQSNNPKAESAATAKSPGASNNFSDGVIPFPSASTVNSKPNSNVWLYALLAVGIFLIVRK